MHGLGGGVGVSSAEVSHAYPTKTCSAHGLVARSAIEPGPKGMPASSKRRCRQDGH